MIVMSGTAAPKRVAPTAGKRDTGAMLHQVGLKLVEVSTQDSFLKAFRCRSFSVEHFRDGSFFLGATFYKMDKQPLTIEAIFRIQAFQLLVVDFKQPSISPNPWVDFPPKTWLVPRTSIIWRNWCLATFKAFFGPLDVWDFTVEASKRGGAAYPYPP